jgi:aspartate kinase
MKPGSSTSRLPGSRATNWRCIVVVAGFREDESGTSRLWGAAVQTPGRGHRSALNADVQNYTDVDGIYTTKPNICEKAKTDKIIFEEMLEMASLGARC